MHVFLITQYFPPEIGAAASRWGDYTQIMLKQGHSVTVLCETPNYPTGKVFKGYQKKFFFEEKLSRKFKIIRSGVIVNDRSTSIKKLLHYISFAISAIINTRLVKKYDIIIISSPPLFVGIIGLFLKKIKNQNFWIDIRDLWPESIASLVSGKRSMFYYFGKKLESSLYKNAEGIIMPVPGFRKYFDNHKMLKNKLKVELKNGISNSLFAEIKQNKTQIDKNFTVIYSGNFGLAQGLESLINSAEILKDYPINFIMIGDGVTKKEIVGLAKGKKLKNISFSKPVKRKKLISIIKKSSLCLVPLKKDKLFETALPSKMFEYMACSRPVICNEGDAGKIINNINAGRAIKPEDPDLISSAILYYFNNKKKVHEHGENGYNYVKSSMIKEKLLNNAFSKIMKKM